MILHWSPEGRPIQDVLEWAYLYEDPANRFIASSYWIAEETLVSTIWTGMPAPDDMLAMVWIDTDTLEVGTDLQTPRPRIYETAVFVCGDEMFHTHSATREEALEDFQAACVKFGPSREDASD